MTLNINNNKISFPHSRLRFRNFAGINRDGFADKRTFCVDIEDEDLVQDLIEYGFNVKQTQPMDLARYEEVAKQNEWTESYDQYLANFVTKHYIQIKATNKPNEPVKDFVKIYLIDDSTGNAVRIDNSHQSSLASLDTMFYKHVDVVASVYEWHYQNNSGFNLYLNALYMHTEPYSGGGDEFYQKYVLGQDNDADIDLPFE